jgi:hypothetical protein
MCIILYSVFQGLLVNYWLSYDESSVTNVPGLYHIIKVITQLTGNKKILFYQYITFFC